MANSRIYYGAVIKDKALVSIIIPVFNTERYLDKCIQSITCQSYDTIH